MMPAQPFESDALPKEAFAATMPEKGSRTFAEIADAASDLSKAAAHVIDTHREPAAGALEAAAADIHAHADQLPGGEPVARLAHQTADGLDATAGYVREKTITGMIGDLEHLIQLHPTASVLCAGVLGFLMARRVGRN